jgi:hypothetical protein
MQVAPQNYPHAHCSAAHALSKVTPVADRMTKRIEGSQRRSPLAQAHATWHCQPSHGCSLKVHTVTHRRQHAQGKSAGG